MFLSKIFHYEYFEIIRNFAKIVPEYHYTSKLVIHQGKCYTRNKNKPESSRSFQIGKDLPKVAVANWFTLLLDIIIHHIVLKYTTRSKEAIE